MGSQSDEGLDFIERTTIYKKIEDLAATFILTMPFAIIALFIQWNSILLIVMIEIFVFNVLWWLLKSRIVYRLKLSKKNLEIPYNVIKACTGAEKVKSFARVGIIGPINGPAIIYHSKIIGIREIEGTIYISYTGLAQSIIIHPDKTQRFLKALEKTVLPGYGVSIVRNSPYLKNQCLTEFSNYKLVLKPSIIIPSAIFIALLLFICADAVDARFVGGSILLAMTFMAATIAGVMAYDVGLYLYEDELVRVYKAYDSVVKEERILYKDIARVEKEKSKIVVHSKDEDMITFVSKRQKEREYFCDVLAAQRNKYKST